MLRSRIITALVLAAALLAVLFLLPPLATLVLLTVIIVAGAWEWSAFFRGASRALRLAYVALIALLIGVAWYLIDSSERLLALLAAATAWWVAAFLWLTLAPRRVSNWSAALAGILALVPAWVAVVALRNDTHGAQLTLCAIAVIVGADVGAFFCGRAFGRVRLAPFVSPGKTWEGLIGGIMLAMLLAIISAPLFGLERARFAPLALAAVAFSVVGDLLESMLKRYAGVKDSGSMFPGHGGVLDRIDSLLAAVPVLVLGLHRFGVLE